MLYDVITGSLAELLGGLAVILTLGGRTARPGGDAAGAGPGGRAAGAHVHVGRDPGPGRSARPDRQWPRRRKASSPARRAGGGGGSS